MTTPDQLLVHLATETAAELSARATRDRLGRMNERDHLQPSCLYAARTVAALWVPESQVSTTVPLASPAWPRVGRFDIAFLIPEQQPIAIELKCGIGRDAIAACAWDLLKLAFALQTGVISTGYMMAATTSAEWERRTRGAELFDSGSVDAQELRERFVDWWKVWERDGYPAATNVPRACATRAVSQIPFPIGHDTWELRVAAVGIETTDQVPWEPLLQAEAARTVTRLAPRRSSESSRPLTVEHETAEHVGVGESLAKLQAREEARFAETHPRSSVLAERARGNLFEGVPMHWMRKWPGGFPVFVREAKGARFTDVDGLEYVDFCLGDTGAMTGHAPDPTLRALAEQAPKGITLMLPSEDALWVSQELARRFGVGSWQFALTATDANRFSIRLARHLTGRPKVLVFNWCYHGTVDETFATLVDGVVGPRSGNLGPPVNPAETTRVVEFNDVDGLERELAHGDVAVVLTEPALTNIGMVFPEPGFHDALRELTLRHGTLLAIDETHTICCGPGGYTAAHGLVPDIVTIGKPIAGGIPAAAYGLSEEVAARLGGRIELEDVDVGGIGGTLAANALSLAVMRATLAEVLTEEAFARMIPLAARWTAGADAGIAEAGLPWHVSQLGCRAEYLFGPDRPRNGTEAHGAGDVALERYMHLYALNRGILLTPFHNMALMSPATTEADVDRHTEVFREAVLELAGYS